MGHILLWRVSWWCFFALEVSLRSIGSEAKCCLDLWAWCQLEWLRELLLALSFTSGCPLLASIKLFLSSWLVSFIRTFVNNFGLLGWLIYSTVTKMEIIYEFTPINPRFYDIYIWHIYFLWHIRLLSVATSLNDIDCCPFWKKSLFFLYKRRGN